MAALGARVWGWRLQGQRAPLAGKGVAPALSVEHARQTMLQRLLQPLVEQLGLWRCRP